MPLLRITKLRHRVWLVHLPRLRQKVEGGAIHALADGGGAMTTLLVSRYGLAVADIHVENGKAGVTYHWNGIKHCRMTDDITTARDVAKVSPKQAAQNLIDAGYDVEVQS